MPTGNCWEQHAVPHSIWETLQKCAYGYMPHGTTSNPRWHIAHGCFVHPYRFCYIVRHSATPRVCLRNTQSVGERQGQCSLYHQNGSSRLGSRNWKLDRATAVSLTRWAPTFPTTIRHMISYKEVIPMGFLGPTAFPLFDLGSAGPEGFAVFTFLSMFMADGFRSSLSS